MAKLRRKKTAPESAPPTLEAIHADRRQLEWDAFRRRMTDALAANEERVLRDLKARARPREAATGEIIKAAESHSETERLRVERAAKDLKAAEQRFKRLRRFYSKERPPEDWAAPYSEETGKPAETVKRFSLSAGGFEDDWGAIPKRRFVLTAGDPVPPAKQAEFGCTVVPPGSRFVWEEEVDDDDEAEPRPAPKPQRVLSEAEKETLRKAALQVPMGALAPMPAAAPRLQPAAAGVVDASVTAATRARRKWRRITGAWARGGDHVEAQEQRPTRESRDRTGDQA
jgi:hypothetical protein